MWYNIMYMNDSIEGENLVAILGFGTTGKSILKYLKSKNKSIIIIDDYVDFVEGHTVVTSDIAIKNNLNLEYIIKSPGIRYTNPVLLHYKDVKCTNDIELYYNEVKDTKTKIIGITGTNGKTSTVTLLNKILNYCGFRSEAAGNIGMSPLEFIGIDLDYIVLELSSFQLKQINDFKAYAAFFLNFSPDHLDYHTDLLDYYSSKLNIIKNGTVSNKIYIGENNLKIDTHLEVVLPEDMEFDYSIIDMGLNPSNVEIIYAFIKNENINDFDIVKFLKKHNSSIEHRVEYVDTINNIRFYNDSKATNVQSSSMALKRLKNIILLVGGYNKNEDLSKLSDYLDNVKHVIAYGENKKEFKFIKKVIIKNDLEESFKQALKLAESGDIVLLSPCSASYDQFTNYVQRGMYFKELVLNYKENNEIYN